jgi:hypothetical protein
MPRTCSVDGCNRKHNAHGLCAMHGLRLSRYGDPSVTKRARGLRNSQFKHGLSRTPIYRCWNNMMRRCYDVARDDYRNYGAKGIRVCERWHHVENFVADMSPRPAGGTIERRDNLSDYSPDNCTWASRFVQATNRSTTKISVDVARAIKALAAQGMRTVDISKRLNVGYKIALSVMHGHTWKAIS